MSAEEVTQPKVVQKKESETRPKASGPPSKPPEFDFDRRRVIRWMGWGSMWLFITLVTGGAARLFFPRVLFEPPTKFKIGFPIEYSVGAVNEKYIQKYRIWVVKEFDRLYVIEAKCTHLGCTPNWLDSEKKFKCPCHGSGFTPDGINIEGPAPRPLERFKVTLAEDGQIVVDQAVRFRGERGEWGKVGAYIPV
ncbi:MAG: QcrA and Rieske domain-containing protein [Candidatus Brocadiales bacterium]